MMLVRIAEAIEAGELAREATGASRELALALTKLEEAEYWATRARAHAKEGSPGVLVEAAFDPAPEPPPELSQ